MWKKTGSPLDWEASTRRGAFSVLDHDRRKRARVPLRCPLRLSRRGLPALVSGETIDVSSAGFYCMVQEAFSPGENLECFLTLPAGNFGYSTSNVTLQCDVEVTRVEPQGAGFGVACRIDHYRLTLGPNESSRV